jgi:hypothetical protein
MRSEFHEPGRGWMASAAKPGRRTASGLQASIVDAVLGDDSMTMSPAGARRDVAHATASADGADTFRATGASDGPLLRQLSQQLSMLEAQQQQIRRLLEQTEQRPRGVVRVDR